MKLKIDKGSIFKPTHGKITANIIDENDNVVFKVYANDFEDLKYKIKFIKLTTA